MNRVTKQLLLMNRLKSSYLTRGSKVKKISFSKNESDKIKSRDGWLRQILIKCQNFILFFRLPRINYHDILESFFYPVELEQLTYHDDG